MRRRSLLALAVAVVAGCAAVTGLDAYEIVSAPDDAASDVPALPEASVDADLDPRVDAAPDAEADAAPDPCAACRAVAQTSCADGGCSAARRVFVSSTTMTANLGGAAGADAACQQLANTAKLTGTWRAWLSDANTGPRDRFAQATTPYRLLDGSLVAVDWQDLVDGTLSHPINRDEKGAVVRGEVWTGTSTKGEGTFKKCSGFGTADHNATPGHVGISDVVDGGWTERYEQFCDRTDVHLYCFEQ